VVDSIGLKARGLVRVALGLAVESVAVERTQWTDPLPTMVVVTIAATFRQGIRLNLAWR